MLAERERLAEDVLEGLTQREIHLKEREVLLVEVEECVAACHMAIEDCIKKEIQHGLEVMSF